MFYYFNNAWIGFISTCKYAKCNNDQVMNVSHNHTCMPVTCMLTTPWKRFNEKQYTYVYIQTHTDPKSCYYTTCTVRFETFLARYSTLLERYVSFLERYGSFLERCAFFLHGTVRFMNGTFRFLYGTFSFLYWTVWWTLCKLSRRSFVIGTVLIDMGNPPPPPSYFSLKSISN